MIRSRNPQNQEGVLLVDVGNSRVKWRLLDRPDLDGTCLHDQLVSGVPRAWCSIDKPSMVLMSLVTGDRLKSELCQWCQKHWGILPRFAKSTDEVPGLENRYTNPAQLGVDRWLAIVASRRLGTGTTVVVDCGTAITMDLVDRTGVFHGGLIMPGRSGMEAIFRQRAPHLEVSTGRRPDFPAKNTADAIALGIQTAVVASVEQFIDNSTSLTGDAPVVRLTGGDSAWLQSIWPGNLSVHDNLVLDGLQILLELDA